MSIQAPTWTDRSRSTALAGKGNRGAGVSQDALKSGPSEVSTAPDQQASADFTTSEGARPAAAPPDAAAHVVGPTRHELRRNGVQCRVETAKPLQGKAEPGDVVVIFVRPAAEVPQPHRRHEIADEPFPCGRGRAQLGVDQAV